MLETVKVTHKNRPFVVSLSAQAQLNCTLGAATAVPVAPAAAGASLGKAVAGRHCLRTISPSPTHEGGGAARTPP